LTALSSSKSALDGIQVGHGVGALSLSTRDCSFGLRQFQPQLNNHDARIELNVA
jgi:hypothetical protein